MVTKEENDKADNKAEDKPNTHNQTNPAAKQQGPGGKVQDRAPGTSKPPASTETSAGRKSSTPDNDLTAPDADDVVQRTAKAEEARAKLAHKNAVSVSKDDHGDVLGVATEHFNVGRGDHFGINVVNVSKRGYVGPAQLVLTEDELDELVDALNKF